MQFQFGKIIYVQTFNLCLGHSGVSYLVSFWYFFFFCHCCSDCQWVWYALYKNDAVANVIKWSFLRYRIFSNDVYWDWCFSSFSFFNRNFQKHAKDSKDSLPHYYDLRSLFVLYILYFVRQLIKSWMASLLCHLCSVQFWFVRTFQELRGIFLSMQTSFPRKLIVTPLSCILLNIGQSRRIANLVLTLSLFCMFALFEWY